MLAPTELAARRGRRFVRQVLVDAGLDEAVEMTVLLANELITNAVLHGRSELELLVELDRGAVRVGVTDQNSRHPVVQEHDDEALDGRGLAMVDLVADAWGVTDAPGGKTVWFCLRVDG